MGLFSKKGGKQEKAAKVKVENPKASAKKSLFGGKKKDLTLIERMQLEESVAAASLEVVQEQAGSDNSAVREVDEGLIIIAFTNDMLDKAQLESTSEEFGSFAEALRSETIESIALTKDLANGVIGIIPSHETLISLDEFDFVHDMAFRWAILPFDTEDEGELILLDDTVHVERLVELSNDPSIQLSIEDGKVVESEPEYQYDLREDDTHDNHVNNSEEEGDGMGANFPDDEQENFDNVPNDDVPFDVHDDNDFPDFPDVHDSSEEFGVNTYPHDDGSGQFDAPFDNGGLYDGTHNFGDEELELEVDDESAEQTKEDVQRLANHGFNNTELGIAVDMQAFDDYFSSISIAQFDTTRQDGSELHNVLAKLRQDANVELTRFHQENIQTLRNRYVTNMRDIHNKLVESLDHKSTGTTYGSKYAEIEGNYEDEMDKLDEHTAGKVKQVRADYDDRREEYAENAKRSAMSEFDRVHGDERETKISRVRDDIQSELKTNRDMSVGELYSDRRNVAQRLFDKATTSLLQVLQDEHQRISRTELHMYDAFRKDMDIYLRKHFADEVLRAKAEAEKLKQSHEAERVRKEYEQMFITKAKQLEEADIQARESLRQLEITHKEQVQSVREDYDRRIERERRDNQELRDMLQQSNDSNVQIGVQKEKEIEHRLNLYQDTIKSKDLELKYANERASKSQKPLMFIMIGVGAVALALGIIFGFLYGAGSTTQQIAPGNGEAPQAHVIQQESHVHVGQDIQLTDVA